MLNEDDEIPFLEGYKWASPSQQLKSGMYPNLSPSSFLSRQFGLSQSPSTNLWVPNVTDPSNWGTTTTVNVTPMWGTYGSTYGGLLSTISTIPAPNIAIRKVDLPKRKASAPIIGFRAWGTEIVKRKPTLCSVAVTYFWSSGRAEKAMCRNGAYAAIDHPVPHPACSCGLHACSTLALAAMQNQIVSNDPYVYGACVGWGRVLRHEDQGWRAEYVRPIALLDSRLFDEDDALVEVAKHYGLPILDRRALLAYVAEYGEYFPREINDGEVVF